MPLELGGDLDLLVEGPAGATRARVRGRGDLLLVDADDPVAVWDAALGSVSTGPRVLRRVADALADNGVVLQVSGPRGVVATVGAGIDSTLGQVATGSRRVRLGGPAAVRPLALAKARQSVGAVPREVLVAFTVLLVLRRLLRR